MFAPAYLDHNASTPLDARVREAMLPWLGGGRWGNASSRHEYGRQARAAIDQARQQVAAAVNAHPTEVIFTSGGSESNNLFIKGAAANLPVGRIAIGATEHPCVREPARQLQRAGWRLDELPLSAEGALDTQAALDQVLRDKPALVSVMLANNETGVLNDLVTLAKTQRAQGGYIHCDAVQALGKIPLDFRALGVHGLTLSSHKVYGPLGAGALVLDKRVELEALIGGGGQERGLRSGTENVAAIVGFGLACELQQDDLPQRVQHMQTLRDCLEIGLQKMQACLFGVQAARLPNTSFFAFEGVDGETLVGKLDRAGFAMASGAACSSANPEPSRTLLAMGVAPELARGAVRVSVGQGTQMSEIESFLLALRQTLNELKNLTALAV
ncbi:cysteine desulfurase family protein [Uliginosibacterium aquaticum]|uniref:Cysteine desulfurase n=1 Tax=Uliginosibacterium aquaticum TaxID=2731212 RepID=A0ABX2IP60_9RHOO|nr:cysteine desulfurase family protein [Uliginosibacterium aquaticum]NSL56802.1 cysteine desulfurase [Uliginosibacterium aquaticum]